MQPTNGPSSPKTPPRICRMPSPIFCLIHSRMALMGSRITSPKYFSAWRLRRLRQQFLRICLDQRAVLAVAEILAGWLVFSAWTVAARLALVRDQAGLMEKADFW